MHAGRAEVGGYRDRLRQRAADQLGQAGDELADVDHLRLQRLLAREGEQALDQLHAAARRLQRRFDEFVEFGVIRTVILQRRQVADDDGEQVVEVVGQAAGQLANGLHFLGLDEGGLHALLFGDVVREDEEAEVFALRADFRNQRALRMDGLALALHLVFVGHLLPGQRLAHRILDLGIDLGADHVEHVAVGHRALRVAVPVRVALVGVAIDLVLVHVADEDGDGVVDQAQAGFAAAEGGGDALVFLVRLAQVGEGVFKLGGAPAHTLFELDVLVLGQVFDVALFGDIAVQRDETAMRQRLAAQQQDTAVRTLAFGDMRREVAGGSHALGDLHFPVAGAVFAALGVVADEAFERCADIGQLVGKFEQLEEGAVPRHQA